MRKILLFFLTLILLLLLPEYDSCFFSCCVYAQSTKDTRAKLKHKGLLKTFHISEDGNIYIISEENNTYHLYKTDLESTIWTESELKFMPKGYYSGDAFCSLEGGVVIIGNADYSGKKVFYRSENNGKGFKNVGPKTDHAIYEMWTDGKSKIAAVSGGTEFFLSNDAGKTWTFTHFGDKEEDWKWHGLNYQYDLFFDSDGQNGWICENKNRIHHTSDGGKTFSLFKTPYEQLNIKTPNNDVDRLRHIGNHYFCKQGSVYYSPTDSLNWQKVDTLSWFDRTADGGMIAITTSDMIVAFDENLQEIWKHSVTGMSYKHCVCKNKLYYLTMDNDIYEVGKDGVVCMPKFTSLNIEYSDDELKNVFQTKDGRDYMINHGDITCRDTPSGPWYRITTYPDVIQEHWENDTILYVADRKFNKFRLDHKTNSLIPYTYDWSALKKIDVVSIAFIKHEAGYPIGCNGPYVNYSQIVSYKLTNDKFICTEEDVIADFLKKHPHLNVKRDSSLLRLLPQSLDKSDITELKSLVEKAMAGDRDSFMFDVSKNERDSFKQNIESDYYLFRNDKDLYTQYIDTVNFENFSLDLLHKIFSKKTYGFKGSSIQYIVALKLLNGEYLTIFNGEAWSNYMGTPYIGYYKDEPFEIPNVNVGIKINEITKEKFVPCNNKQFGLLKLVEYMIEDK